MFLFKQFNHRILGNLSDQCMIGAYFHWESPYILPKGVFISCVARNRHHVCL